MKLNVALKKTVRDRKRRSPWDSIDTSDPDGHGEYEDEVSRAP